MCLDGVGCLSARAVTPEQRRQPLQGCMQWNHKPELPSHCPAVNLAETDIFVHLPGLVFAHRVFPSIPGTALSSSPFPSLCEFSASWLCPSVIASRESALLRPSTSLAWAAAAFSLMLLASMDLHATADRPAFKVIQPLSLPALNWPALTYENQETG